MQRTASEEARTSEEIVIEDPPVKYVEEPLHKPRKSIKKIDSAKLFTVEKQKHITSSNLKDKKVQPSFLWLIFTFFMIIFSHFYDGELYFIDFRF